jgi:hypothetical protein
MKNLFSENKDSVVWAWLCFVIGMVIIFIIIVGLSGCSSTPHPTNKMSVMFWAGDSVHEGVSRMQENKTLACADPIFDNYVCLSYGDLQEIYQSMLQCSVLESFH